MTAAGRITRDEMEACYLKPLSVNDEKVLAKLLEDAEERGDAAVKIENETRVTLFLVRVTLFLVRK